MSSHTTSHRKLQAQFEWTIRDWQCSAEYKKNDKENVETSIKSPHFQTEKGVQWQMAMIFKPKEKNDEHPKVEFVCCCITKPSYNPETDCLEIQGTITAEKTSGEDYCIKTTNIKQFITEKPWGISWEIYSDNLTENFDIIANLTIGGWKTNKEVLYSKKAKPPQLPTLLVSNKEFCDVTIVVEGQTIPAHRAVLAVRSPVLQAMLSADMKEKQESRIVLDDVSAEAWRIFQQFLYTDNFDSSLKFDLTLLVELLILSDKYQVKTLRDGVEEEILRSMNIKNVFEVIDLVEKFDIPGFNEKASDIMKANWVSLKKQPHFMNWLTSGSSIAIVLLGKLRI